MAYIEHQESLDLGRHDAAAERAERERLLREAGIRPAVRYEVRPDDFTVPTRLRPRWLARLIRGGRHIPGIRLLLARI